MSRPTLAGLWRGIEQRARSEFLVTAAGRQSYGDLAEAVRRWLSEFDRAGLDAGDRIVIRTAHQFGAASCFIAGLLDGVVPVMTAPDSPDGKLLAQHALVEARARLLDRADAPTELAALPGTTLLDADLTAAGGLLGRARRPVLLPGLSPHAATRPPRLPEDDGGLAYLLFTSGTTASPSGVMITRGNLLAQLETLLRVFRYDADSRIFNDMSLAHADGMVQGPLLALAARCTAVRAGGFELGRLENWLDTVRRERITHVIAVPTVWAMIDAYARHDDYFDAPECRALISVAARLTDELWGRLEQRFARPVYNQYGLSETVTTALYAGPDEGLGGFGTIGRPIDCEARIDPATASSGEGELQLRGANVFPGYWRAPERTAASFTEDGWFKTGDLARLRNDGAYEILGRIKSVIKTGGYLVRPDEIDEAMLRHPDVRESVTLGIEDPIFGEVPVTAVVCTRPPSERHLAEHARAFLEPFKVPRNFVVLDAIPRGISGKPQLAELKALLGGAQPSRAGAAIGDARLSDEVVRLAGEVFRADPGLLAPHSRQGDVPGWDSFAQLGFVLAVEQHFGITIPAARIARIATIADMIAAIEDLRG